MDCPREWKEPFHAVAGERPEFFPRTLVEMSRAHASAMAVVGTAEEKASLAFSSMEGYQRIMTGEQHKSRLSRIWCPAPSLCRVQHFPYISGWQAILSIKVEFHKAMSPKGNH